MSPYIPLARRADFIEDHKAPLTPGELNFIITSEVLDYLDTVGRNYQTFNEVIGVLECAKLEAYRRVIAPYEDKKMVLNGDVYP